ncbi:MAG: transposase [Candidatus Brocadiaceae bacterium]|nr:transposase [Candidatus Brocadiaceae bacterium]
MTRPLRIEYEGAFYHVLSRGNERKEIFRDDKDRSLFTEILGEMSSRFSVDIFAYVLMDNHYHVLLRTNRPNISKSIQWLGVAYTRRFNIRHHRNGHLFQGRFKSFLIENEKYLLVLSCYIHRNPLRANMVRRLVDYQWSSYKVYAYGKSSPDWLRTEVLLSQIPGKDKNRGYRELVQDYSREEKRIWEDFRYGLLFGSKEYCNQIRSKYLTKKEPDVEIPQKRLFLREEDVNVVLERTASAMGCNISALINPKRIRSGLEKDKRDILIYVLWNTGLYRNNEIAKIFNLSYSSVSKQVHNIKLKLSKEPHIKRIFKRANSLFKM